MICNHCKKGVAEIRYTANCCVTCYAELERKAALGEELAVALYSLMEKSRSFAGMHTSGYLNEIRYRHDGWEAMLDAIGQARAALAKYDQAKAGR